jgi:hypothetical protein
MTSPKQVLLASRDMKVAVSGESCWFCKRGLNGEQPSAFSGEDGLSHGQSRSAVTASENTSSNLSEIDL